MKPFPTSAACCFGILFISVSLITTGSSEVVGSADTVVALTGDDVILPCFLKTSVSAKNMVVEWTRLNLTPENVHLYRDNRDSYEEQHPSYKGRTSLFNDELKNGNVSLKLTRVTLSDAGSYRCFIPTLTSQVKETTVQLFVGAASQPVISIDGTKGWGLVLKCESGGWYPEPEMAWLDSSGSILPADGPPERHSYSEGRYTVRRHVTVNKTDTNRFTCIVQQPEINHMKETEIHVPDDLFPKSQVGLIVGLLISAAVVVLAASAGVYMWRKHKEEAIREKDERIQNLSGQLVEAIRESDERIQNLSGQLVEVITERGDEHIQNLSGQLVEAIRERDEHIQNLSGQLDQLRMQNAVALFVDMNRVHLIQTVTTVIPIAFYLIRSEKYSEIHAAGTRQDQMELLYKALDSGGEKLKSDFYRILQDLEPDLVIFLAELSMLNALRMLNAQLRKQNDEVTRERDEVTRERDELKEELRKAKETIKTLSTSPGGQQKTQTPSQKGMEMQPLLGSGPQKDDLDEMERGGRV